MSSTNKGSERFVCPFFRSRQGRLMLLCEGPEKGARVRIRFDSGCHLAGYMNTYCWGFSYTSCPIARGTEASYEKG